MKNVVESSKLQEVRTRLFNKYGVQFTDQTALQWIEDQRKAERKLRKRMSEERERSMCSSIGGNVAQLPETPPREVLWEENESASGSEDSFHTAICEEGNEAANGMEEGAVPVAESVPEAEKENSIPEENESVSDQEDSDDSENSDDSEASSSDSTETCHALLLRNRGTDCFVNSAVNILSAVDDIRLWAESLFDALCNNNSPVEPEPEPMTLELCRVLSGRCMTTARIRKEFENEDLQYGQNDANEAFHELMKSVPAAAKTSIVIERIAKWNCEDCGDSETVTEKLEDIYRAIYEVSEFFNILREEAQERTCLRCDKQKEKEVLNYSIPDSTSHIIVRLSKGEPEKYVTNIPEQFALGASQWKMVCASHYLPNRWLPYGRGGHYVTWWKMGELWKCISDSDVHTFEEISFDTLDIGIIVYKRV